MFFLAVPPPLGVSLPSNLVLVLLELPRFFPARVQMILLEHEKQYYLMDPHLASLGHFGLYSSL
jgi:hypothetical protein